MKVRELELAGEAGARRSSQAPSTSADEELFKNVRAVFGGNVRQATSGAAPIAQGDPRVLLRLRRAGARGLRHDRDGDGGDDFQRSRTTSSAPSAARCPGVELKIADDGEVLIKGANIFAGYHNNADASFGAVEDGWLHTGDLGSLDEDGYLSITGRKKDIIITAGGKNLTPANIENDLKQCRWISQAVMHGDRRPYPVMLVTLDEEEIVPLGAAARPPGRHRRSSRRHPDVHALIQAAARPRQREYAQVEQVKKFAILDHDLSQETGELTPTLKVKRNVVNEKYAERLRRALRGLSSGSISGSTAADRQDSRYPRTRRMRTDPTDTGGLFVSRRPGTPPGPLPHAARARQRAAPARSTASSRPACSPRWSLVNLLCWGPLPLACLWLGCAGPVRHRQRRRSASSSRSSTLFGGLLLGPDARSSGSTTPGSSCAAPPGTTSARA